MDTFVEQIIKIKKTVGAYLACFTIVLTALIILLFSLIFLTPFALVFLLLLSFCVYKLCSFFNIEYEYIVTNTTLDIDKIIAKSSRKRMFSFEISSIQRIEKFTGTLPNNVDIKNCFFACNKDDVNAVVVYYKEEGKQQKVFVFAPDERVRESIKSILPRYIGENL